MRIKNAYCSTTASLSHLLMGYLFRISYYAVSLLKPPDFLCWMLQEKNAPEIELKAMGRAINKTVTIAEILKVGKGWGQGLEIGR